MFSLLNHFNAINFFEVLYLAAANVLAASKRQINTQPEARGGQQGGAKRKAPASSTQLTSKGIFISRLLFENETYERVGKFCFTKTSIRKAGARQADRNLEEDDDQDREDMEEEEQEEQDDDEQEDIEESDDETAGMSAVRGQRKLSARSASDVAVSKSLLVRDDLFMHRSLFISECHEMSKLSPTFVTFGHLTEYFLSLPVATGKGSAIELAESEQSSIYSRGSASSSAGRGGPGG